jgi:hypothetical protein
MNAIHIRKSYFPEIPSHLCIGFLSSGFSIKNLYTLLILENRQLVKKFHNFRLSRNYCVQTDYGTHPAYPKGTGGCFPTRVKQMGHEADHSGAEDKNEWSYTFTPPYIFISTRDNFTFTVSESAPNSHNTHIHIIGQGRIQHESGIHNKIHETEAATGQLISQSRSYTAHKDTSHIHTITTAYKKKRHHL